MEQIYKFGTFEADLVKRELRQSNQLVPLTPKVFQTLAILLQNHQRIVSKHELLSAIWPDCHIEEGNLTQNISVLRKALDETNCATKFIATFPKQGYRFTGEVAEIASAGVEYQPSTPTGRNHRYLWFSALMLFPLTLVAIIVGLVRHQPPRPELAHRYAVTHLRGRQYQPVLSPDGTRLAFVSHEDLDGRLRIGILDLAKSSEPRLIGTTQGDAFSPAWSPDGHKLAYLHAHDMKITIVLQEPDGKPETLTDIFPESCGVVSRRLDWSPDGRFLAVSTKSAPDAPFRIELLRIGEARRTVLTTPAELSDGDFQPRFSPDGSKLAFVRIRDISTMEILYVPIPGGDPVAVTDRRDRYGDIDWTPDSRSLLFTRERQGKSQIYRVALVNGGAKSKNEFVAEGSDTKGLLQFSAAGRSDRLVLAHAEPDENIWRAKLTPTHEIAAWERLIASTGVDFSPVYSPDSRRLVFLSDRSGDQQLWSKEPDGRERQLTFGQLKPGAASWTAKGDVVVFSSVRQRVLYRMVVNGGSPVPIQVGTVGAHTAVSPGGDWVYFVRRFYIMRAPGSGGPPTQMTDQGGFPLRLSPDGEWIYYVPHRYSSEIWRQGQSNGVTQRLTNRLRPGCWACWSVNSTALVYVPPGDDGVVRLERLELASGQIHDLGRVPGRLPTLGLGMVALSPDDSSLAVVVAEPGIGDIEISEQTLWSRADNAVISSQR